MKPWGLIVAGGKSERFGSPKILHEIDGVPQWQRLVDALSPHCERVVLNISEELRPFFTPNTPFEILVENEHLGPLEGLCKAFETYPNRDWLVVACDHFWVEASAFEQLNALKSLFFQDEQGNLVPWLGKITKMDIEFILQKKKEGEQSLMRILERMPVTTVLPSKKEWILDADSAEKIQLLHPSKSAIKLEVFKYVLIKHFILRTLKNRGSISFSELKNMAEIELNHQIKGSISWNLIHVKMDLEARGIICRIPQKESNRVDFLSLVEVW
jgi:molybdopterin-guanine dinucleotide biosynthesis protein A